MGLVSKFIIEMLLANYSSPIADAYDVDIGPVILVGQAALSIFRH